MVLEAGGQRFGERWAAAILFLLSGGMCLGTHVCVFMELFRPLLEATSLFLYSDWDPSLLVLFLHITANFFLSILYIAALLRYNSRIIHL